MLFSIICQARNELAARYFYVNRQDASKIKHEKCLAILKRGFNKLNEQHLISTCLDKIFHVETQNDDMLCTIYCSAK